MTHEMCNEVVLRYPYMLVFVSDELETREVFDKVVKKVI